MGEKVIQSSVSISVLFLSLSFHMVVRSAFLFSQLISSVKVKFSFVFFLIIFSDVSAYRRKMAIIKLVSGLITLTVKPLTCLRKTFTNPDLALVLKRGLHLSTISKKSHPLRLSGKRPVTGDIQRVDDNVPFRCLGWASREVKNLTNYFLFQLCGDI